MGQRMVQTKDNRVHTERVDISCFAPSVPSAETTYVADASVHGTGSVLQKSGEHHYFSYRQMGSVINKYCFALVHQHFYMHIPSSLSL